MDEPPRRRFDSGLRHTNQAYLQPCPRAAATPPQGQRAGFVLLEHFSMMAFTAAVDVLVTANLVAASPLYRIRTMSPDGASVLSDLGISVAVDCDLAGLAGGALDLLFVCGGYRTTLQPRRPLLTALRAAARRPLLLGGLWNGSCVLAQAGLLDGYACTVHPDSRAALEETFPRVRVLAHPYVIDRERASCAGANSALGMMLAILRSQQGDELVRGIEEILACDRSPDLHDQPMVTLVNDPLLPQTLRAILERMETNIEEPLAIDDLAHRAHISRRQLDRLFQHHMRCTPSRYYLELRITRARRLLLQTGEPITRIALACGFASVPHFSRCYREFFGQPPSRCRLDRAQE